MGGKQRRRLLEKKYHHYYKRTTLFDLNNCSYCGAPSQLLDHVPPLSSLDNINIKNYQKQKGKFILYPSCVECNAILGSYPEVSILKRLDKLQDKYEKKLKTIPLWTKEELNELGYNLKTYIERNRQTADFLAEKINNIQSRISELLMNYNIEDI